IGVIALGTGYGIAINVEAPLSALRLFFGAVILVMIGTYALFTSGSIVVLKALRKNKRFYYKTENFISVSGMMYRMKQNAVGLANICILSTAVLVLVSTTVALYVGMEDVIKTRFPRNIIMSAPKIIENQAQRLDGILEAESKNSGIDIKNKISYWNNSFPVTKKDGKFSITSNMDMSSNVNMITLIPISDYNRLEGKNITLEGDEVLLYSKAKNLDKNSITIDNKTFRIKQVLDKPVAGMENQMDDIVDNYILFTNDINAVGKNGLKEYLIGVDVQGSDKDILSLANKLSDKFKENSINVNIDSSAGSKQDLFMLYGGLFFIGIFLGALFLMATVLIIYYKQISEGYDDKERFEIMQKVGMSRGEIKKTIRSQVLMVFFLPLATAIIHIAFAFPMITKLLAVLNLKNVSLFMQSTVMTILVFAVIYAIVFSMTERAYYKIVE
ncbi:MAG TPA: cell division protein FtsX, partial [Clostridiaceae bacterium]|nr:cell division protein FtsX [Clostridiaceae bacterium]